MGEREYVDEELAMARQALSDAEQLASGTGSTEGIVNRLYYACFHAAQAALYDRGVDPGSHGAVRNLFGSKLVLDGDATREQGRLLTTLADFRQQADYGYEPLHSFSAFDTTRSRASAGGAPGEESRRQPTVR